MNVNICCTCVGGVYFNSIQSCLRDAQDFNATIIGVDMSDQALGRETVDIFETVPSPKDSNAYISRMKELIKKHSIQILLPGSEGEAAILSEVKDEMQGLGCVISVQPMDVLNLVKDKFKFLECLNTKGIDAGRTIRVSDESEFQSAYKELKELSHKVVFKPIDGAGSRGVIIVDEDKNEIKYLLGNRFCVTGNLDSCLKEIEKENIDLAGYMAMPYYGPETYDVDCLANKGEMVECVPRLRVYENPLSPVNEGCEVDRNPKILKYLSDICKALDIHGPIDVDIALDKDKNPKILDVGSRMSGSVSASYAVGVNFPAQVVRVLLGLELEKYDCEEGVLIRPSATFIKTKVKK